MFSRVWDISVLRQLRVNFFLDSYAFGDENGPSESIPGASIRAGWNLKRGRFTDRQGAIGS